MPALLQGSALPPCRPAFEGHPLPMLYICSFLGRVRGRHRATSDCVGPRSFLGRVRGDAGRRRILWNTKMNRWLVLGGLPVQHQWRLCSCQDTDGVVGAGGLGRYPDPLGAWIRPGRWGMGEGWGGEGRSLLRPVLLEHQPCLPCSPGSVPGMSSVCPVGGLRIRLLLPDPPASSPAASRTRTCTSPHRLVPHVAPFSSPPPRAAVLAG